MDAYGTTLDSLAANKLALIRAQQMDDQGYREYLNQVANTNLRRLDNERKSENDKERNDIARYGARTNRIGVEGQNEIGRTDAQTRSRYNDLLNDHWLRGDVNQRRIIDNAEAHAYDPYTFPAPMNEEQRKLLTAQANIAEATAGNLRNGGIGALDSNSRIMALNSAAEANMAAQHIGDVRNIHDVKFAEIMSGKGVTRWGSSPAYNQARDIAKLKPGGDTDQNIEQAARDMAWANSAPIIKANGMNPSHFTLDASGKAVALQSPYSSLLSRQPAQPTPQADQFFGPPEAAPAPAPAQQPQAKDQRIPLTDPRFYPKPTSQTQLSPPQVPAPAPREQTVQLPPPPAPVQDRGIPADRPYSSILREYMPAPTPIGIFNGDESPTIGFAPARPQAYGETLSRAYRDNFPGIKSSMWQQMGNPMWREYTGFGTFTDQGDADRGALIRQAIADEYE